MKFLMTLLKLGIFFVLFAFALNNQQTVTVNFFFGFLWQAPMVLVVLATFACGLAVGVLVMMPRWWKNLKAAQHGMSGAPSTLADNSSTFQNGI